MKQTLIVPSETEKSKRIVDNRQRYQLEKLNRSTADLLKKPSKHIFVSKKPPFFVEKTRTVGNLTQI